MVNEAILKKPAPLLDDEQIEKQVKPYSKNGFKRFFQKIGRGWLSFWYAWSEKTPTLCKVLYMLFFFIVFSQGVTMLQMVGFMFVPNLFPALASNPWGFPQVFMGLDAAGNNVYWYILGNPVSFFNTGGVVTNTAIPGGGLGYFISFFIVTGAAQFINFPLQRNITFRSKGNIPYQILWYFIGWLLVTPITMAIASAWQGIVAVTAGALNPFLLALLDTILMGGVAMVIFFFVFLMIFPNRDKVYRTAKARYEKNPTEKNKKKYEDAKWWAEFTNADRAAAKAKTVASSRALSFAVTKKQFAKAASELEKAKATGGKKLASAQLKYATLEGKLHIKRMRASEGAKEKTDTAEKIAEIRPQFIEYLKSIGYKKAHKYELKGGVA